MTTRHELAREFADMMTAFHEADLACGDETIRDAVIVKTVALMVLAFGTTPTDDRVPDEDEAIMKLQDALFILKGRGTE